MRQSPVTCLIAGKAHPRDRHGKDILRGIAGNARGDDLIGKEYYYWIPNPVLVENSDDWAPGQTCYLVWDIFGTKNNNPDDCAACEYQLTGSMNISPCSVW